MGNRLTREAWATAVFEDWKAKRPKGASRSVEAFAIEIGLSRGGFIKFRDEEYDGAQDKTMRKVYKAAPPHLRVRAPLQFGEPEIEPPPSGSGPAGLAQDTGHSVASSPGEGTMDALEMVMKMVETLPMHAQLTICEAILKRSKVALTNPPEAARAE